MPLRQLREQNLHILEPLAITEATTKLAEINIRHGLHALNNDEDVVDAMLNRGLQLHGVLYDVGSGILRELSSEEPLDIISTTFMQSKTTMNEATDGIDARASIWRSLVFGWGKKATRRS